MLIHQFSSFKKSKGVTLIELLVAFTISTVLISALVGLFFASTKHHRDTLEVTKLDTELNLVLNSMTSDIQRAGYWASAETSSMNPFMVSGATDLTVSGLGDCILMTYDRNADGSLAALGSGADDERYGYRLSASAIQFRPSGADFSCSAAADAWQNLTDPNLVKIETFLVELVTESVDIDGTGSGTAAMEVRRVNISISGSLVDDPGYVRTLSRTVKIYNDRYVP